MIWVAQGPGPITGGQAEGIRDQEVVGAIQALAPHPENPDIVYIGAVNGGVWRTTDALASSPSWTQLTDEELSLSIGALEFDPTDTTARTLVAGTGRFSSIRRMGGSLIGLLRTTDAGATWTVLDGGGELRRHHITGVAPRGSTIVFSTNTSGLFRSTDTGATWSKISGGTGTGLPAGVSFDLAGSRSNPARLFTHSGGAGIYRSDDTGATWTKVSDAAIDALLGSETNNVRISVGAADNVFVAIANSSRAAGVFRSANGGATWTALDLPHTTEAGGVRFGLHPGPQASIHFSLAADPGNVGVVYIGGDRQPSFNEGAPGRSWPNSLGARDYSGRLFRIEGLQPAGSQAKPLTHSGTASGSAPHADSRDLAFAANGDLIEADDGGVYWRTDPGSAAGDWFSLNGSLQTTEFHSGAWDARRHTIIGGAQDTGTPQQHARSDTRWGSVSKGDGGVVAVDDFGTAGFSTRYSSYYELRDLRRQVFDAAGVLQSTVRMAMVVLGGGPPVRPQFYTPIELNRVTPTRIVFGAENGVYESDDQGDTVTAIAPGVQVNDTGPMAYGAADNADALYVGAGATVLVRTAAHPARLTASAAFPGARAIVGIALDPDRAQHAYVADATNLYRTTDSGATWSDITNGVLSFGGVLLRSVVYCPDLRGGSVVVGTNNGVFAAAAPAFATWSELGALPTVPVLRLQYSRSDRILLAVTLGRGAWTCPVPEEAIA